MTRSGNGKPGAASTQVNVTLDPHWRLVVRMAAEADGVSVPDLLRPVIIRYLKGRMKNEDLAEAVARIEKVQQSRRVAAPNVAELLASPQRGDHARRPRSRGRSQVG